MVTLRVYTDDADAVAIWEVTDANGGTLDWGSPQIAVGDAAYTGATWLGDPGSTRQISLSMPLGLSLAPGVYAAYLKVPSGTDFELGLVHVAARS